MRISSNWKLCPHRQAFFRNPKSEIRNLSRPMPHALCPLPSVFRPFSSVLFLLLILSGCGYRFSGEGPGPQPGLQSIAIPVFENNTTEPGLEALFASALRREFILRSQLQVVPIEKAQAIMRGRIANIYTSRVAQKQVEQTIEMRLFLTVDIRCEDARTGKVIWQYPGYTYYRTYSVSSSDPMMLFENRRRAEEFLSQEMSIRIHDRFLANF